MLKACENIGTESHKASMLATALISQKCFNCGKPRHMQKNCHSGPKKNLLKNVLIAIRASIRLINAIPNNKGQPLSGNYWMWPTLCPQQKQGTNKEET